MKITLSPARNKAIALVIVMIVIVVLAILAGGLAYSMKVETRLARQSSVEADFEWLGRSGVELAKLVLVEQFKNSCEPFDALTQPWAGGSGGNTNECPPTTYVPMNFSLGSGSGTITIVDNERKFNINVAADKNSPLHPLLNQAMWVMQVDAGIFPEIVDSIVDWVDANENDEPSGAESDYYERLQPPHFAKNGPIDDMNELLMVRGMTPEIFWGTSSSNHPMAAIQQRNAHGFRQRNQPDYAFGLVDVFTPLSNGKLNINTASSNALQMIPGLPPGAVECILQGRPFRTVGEVSCGAGNVIGPTLQKFCTTRSTVFEVTVDCEIAGFRRQYVATLQRQNQRDIRILTLCWKPSGNRGNKTETGVASGE